MSGGLFFGGCSFVFCFVVVLFVGFFCVLLFCFFFWFCSIFLNWQFQVHIFKVALTFTDITESIYLKFHKPY